MAGRTGGTPWPENMNNFRRKHPCGCFFMQEVNAVVELSQLGEVGGSHKFQVVFEAVGDFVPKAKSLIFTLAVGKINTEALQYEELFGRGTHKAP